MLVCKVPQLKADQQTGQYLVFPLVPSTDTDFRAWYEAGIKEVCGCLHCRNCS